MCNKKVVFFFLMLLLILTAAACLHVPNGDGGGGQEAEGITEDLFESVSDITPNNLWTVSEGVTIRLMQDRYPPNMESMTMILENRSDSVLKYGFGYTLEKYENGTWRVVDPRENVMFPAAEMVLYEHDRQTFAFFSASNYERPFDEGLYRIVGWHPKGYQLEFVVSASAAPEPAAIPERSLSEWELPDIEDWQWYNPAHYLDMYRDAGMWVWQYLAGEDGLAAVLYRPASEGTALYADDLLYMDLFDRKTGIRYELFAEPAIREGTVSPYERGFKVEGDEPIYYFIHDSGSVERASLGG